MVALAAFMMTLWCCIGFLWLRDRTKSQTSGLDCSWGLRVDAAFLNRDISSADFDWQVTLQLRNVLNWPLKIETLKTHLEIESIVPSGKIDFNVPAILTAGATANQNYPPYQKGKLPDKDRYKGRIELIIRYRHPDFGYSRIMTRKFIFEQIVKPTMPQGFPGLKLPMSASIPLPIGSYEEDLDEPYIEPKRSQG